MMRVFADLAADVIERNLEKDKQRDEKAKRIQSGTLNAGGTTHFQVVCWEFSQPSLARRAL
jgi:hypothetical protein